MCLIQSILLPYASGVELRHLIYFDAVVRHAGFTRAAEALHVAQPAISTQIKALETELGVQLLRRGARQATLTHAGERFHVHVQAVLGRLEQARAEMGEHAAVTTGHVRLGATPVVGTLPLPDLLARFRRTYPGVSLELRSGLVADLLERLVRGELDVVIGPNHSAESTDLAPLAVADRLVSRTVATDELVLITPPSTALGRVTSLVDVRDQPFVCLPRGSGLSDLLRHHAAGLGFTPNIAFETHSPTSVRELVSAGLGVALIARSLATIPGHPIAVHQLADPPAHPSISVYRAAEISPAARALYDHISADHVRGGGVPGVAT